MQERGGQSSRFTTGYLMGSALVEELIVLALQNIREQRVDAKTPLVSHSLFVVGGNNGLMPILL